MGGQIIDAMIVPAPRQRNSRDDNAKVKAGETPAEWEANPVQAPALRAIPTDPGRPNRPKV
jgi:hypothetical protein